jgi:uncharacterized protein (TIGR01319 family)
VKVDLLVAEIGSTTTTVNAFDGLNTGLPRFLGQGQVRTTVDEGDVNLGLEEALRSLEGKLGEKVAWESFLASSSAAGGLRMSVHGLVYAMTAKAAKEAALGAGAVVSLVTGGEVSDEDLEQLSEINPNIILLAGGVDYGEKETILKNAARLAAWLAARERPAPVIYCGNRGGAAEASRIFREKELSLIVTENVYPQIDQLNILPARTEIQKVFNEHIVEARGMGLIRRLVQGRILPTPGAVMEAALLAYAHLEDLLVFDVGGATTDVHSVTEGSEEIQRLLLHPEPTAKRTVEGDLGVYRNADRVLELCREEGLLNDPADPGLSAPAPIPVTEEQLYIAELMTRQAVKTALLRHVGSWRYIYGPTGRQTVVEGKDLTRIKTVIGTGGALARLPGGEAKMAGALKGKSGLELLPKGKVRYLIDRHYIMAAVGMISRSYPEAGWFLLSQSLGL